MDSTTGSISQMRSTYERNKWKSMSAAEKAFSIRYLSNTNLELKKRLTEKSKPGDVDYKHRSHATQFARGGIIPGFGIDRMYCRDPVTGVWFRDQPEKRRTYMHSGSAVNMRFSDPNVTPAKDSEHGISVWAAPCAGQFWVQKAQPHPKSLTHSGRNFSEPWLSFSSMTGTATMANTTIR